MLTPIVMRSDEKEKRRAKPALSSENDNILNT